MDESEYTLAKRYDYIVETQCKQGCKSYKPRTSSQCNIYKHLLINKDSDLVEKEGVMLDGMRCKGYVSSLKEA